jgi:hypothetical protein
MSQALLELGNQLSLDELRCKTATTSTSCRYEGWVVPQVLGIQLRQLQTDPRKNNSF